MAQQSLAKTELFAQWRQGSMVIADQGTSTGRRMFVHSGTGSDTTGYGANPETPFATIDYAVGQCTADEGDVIYVMPGHAETVSAAGGLDLDVDGISVVGLGQGSLMPTVTLDTDVAADVDVDGANILIENISFESGFADITHGIDVNAAHCTIRGCRFTEAADDENFLICIVGAGGAASDFLVVEDCYVIQDDAANTHFVSLPGTSKGVVVRNNVIIGDFGTAAIGAAGVVVFGTVVDNVIYNAASDVDSCINLAGTGICMRNLACGAAAEANGITAPLWALAGNEYGVITEDLQAILDPLVT